MKRTLKRFIYFLAASTLLGAVPAVAATVVKNNYKVGLLIAPAAQEVVLFRLVGTGLSGCTSGIGVDLTTDAGRSQFSIVLSAKSTGQTVSITFDNDSCMATVVTLD